MCSAPAKSKKQSTTLSTASLKSIFAMVCVAVPTKSTPSPVRAAAAIDTMSDSSMSPIVFGSFRYLKLKKLKSDVNTTRIAIA
jgi:hypothetical protein